MCLSFPCLLPWPKALNNGKHRGCFISYMFANSFDHCLQIDGFLLFQISTIYSHYQRFVLRLNIDFCQMIFCLTRLTFFFILLILLRLDLPVLFTCVPFSSYSLKTAFNCGMTTLVEQGGSANWLIRKRNWKLFISAAVQIGNHGGHFCPPEEKQRN